ncbi:MAG: glycosyltransferase [Flavobacteriales bacterium]|nr:glycosyltransferase [Flavobacteriales bacterium]
MKNRVIISVSNDLSTDQRVKKQCASLQSDGYAVTLLGRELKNSLPISRPYRVRRFKLWFNTGALFYAALNVRLFFYLLFHRADIYYANDLDTLPANFLAAKFRNAYLIYDSHEFFTEVPEIQNRPIVKKTWKFFERFTIERADVVITVNDSIAGLLAKAYNLNDVVVVQNLPEAVPQITKKDRNEIAKPHERICILQGSGINVDRGAEELVDAFQNVENAVLLIVGDGDALPGLKKRVARLGLTNRVIFKPKMPYADMMSYTALADVGFSLDKASNVNYKFSLPNKIFDYAYAGVPVLATDLVEVRKIIETYKFGRVVSNLEPTTLAREINGFLNDKASLKAYRQNTADVVKNLNWQSQFNTVLKRMKDLG